MTFSLLCDTPGRYCIKYRNGTLHDVLTFELIVVLCAVLAIVGYIRASSLFQAEQVLPVPTENLGSDDENNEDEGYDPERLLDSTDVQLTGTGSQS